jgi:hypothetical protein
MAENDNHQQAVRLIFEYDGDQVRLVSQQPVDLLVTSFDPAQKEQQAGVYVDARDDAGTTLASVPAPAAFSASMEVFPERHDEPIVRTDVDRPRGAFTVVVPAPQAVSQVAVVRVAPAAPAPGEVAAGRPQETEVAIFRLNINRP